MKTRESSPLVRNDHRRENLVNARREKPKDLQNNKLCDFSQRHGQWSRQTIIVKPPALHQRNERRKELIRHWLKSTEAASKKVFCLSPLTGIEGFSGCLMRKEFRQKSGCWRVRVCKAWRASLSLLVAFQICCCSAEAYTNIPHRPVRDKSYQDLLRERN